LLRQVESMRDQRDCEDGASRLFRDEMTAKVEALTESKEMLLREKFDLEQRNSEKDREVEILQQEIDTLEQQLHALQQNELPEAQAKVSKAQEELELEKERASALHCENERCKVQINALKSQLDGANKALEILRDKKGGLEAEGVIRENERLRQQLSTATHEKETLQHQNSEAFEAARRRVDTLETQVVPQAESKLNHTAEQLRIALDKVTTLESELSSCKEEVEELQGAIETKSSELETQRNEMEEIAHGNERLENDIRTQKNEHDEKMIRMMEELETLQESFDHIEKTILPQTESELARAMEDLSKQKTKQAGLEEERLKQKQKLVEIEVQLANSRKASEAERESFQNLNEGTNKAMQKLEAEHNRCREELARTQSEMAKKENTIEQMDVALDEAISEADAVGKERDALMNRIKNMKATMDENNQEIKDAQSQNDDASRAIADLERRLFEASQKLNKVEKDKENLEKRNKDLYADVGRNLQRLSVAESQLKETTRERDEAQNYMENFNDRERELHQRLVESDHVRRGLHAKVMQLMGNIRVFVRVRPMSSDEKIESQVERDGRVKGASGSESVFKFPTISDRAAGKEVASADLTKKSLELIEPKKDRGGLKERRTRHRFGFDNVFHQSHGQDDVWESTEPLIQSAMDGHNVSIFAYGQTGSGKTYTMLGEPGNEGLVTRSIKKMFTAKREVEAFSKGQSEVGIKVELLEIYNEQVVDLLSPDNHTGRKNVRISLANHTVEGNRVVMTSTEEECMGLLELAQKRRCVKATSSNSKSSRSHLVFTIHYHLSDHQAQRKGKLHICDLAGSERLSKSKAHVAGGELLQETKNINKSLSTLSNVIEQLQAGTKSVAFRESKLTSLLRDSLGGDSKTLAIICCGPLTSQYHESLSSLRFAEKASNVQLRASSDFKC